MWLTAGISSPRAATSLATSSFSCPSRKLSSVLSRAVLVHVAVQRADRIAVPLERAVERRDVALAVAEDDGVGEVRRRVDELSERRPLLVRLAAGGDETLDDVLAGRRGLGNLDADGIAEKPIGELGDLRRHRRGEEERLPRERQELHDPLDVGDEAHVEHAVGFVDDEDLDAGQKQPPALEMIEQAAGRGNQARRRRG